jgi:hypothetical protein
MSVRRDAGFDGDAADSDSAASDRRDSVATREQPDRMAGPQHGQRQRRALARRRARQSAAITALLVLLPVMLGTRRPEPTIGAEMLSNGQRERGTKSMPFSCAMPARNRSMPAQAIIAALSVQSFSGGAMKAKPASLHRASSVDLIVRLAATPPATTNAGSALPGNS